MLDFLNIKEKGQCYVYVQSKEWHDVLNLKNTLIWYPERGMTFMDTVNYIPFVKSIMTENPYLIDCYDRTNVWILEGDKWVNPDIQTFGASITTITENILKWRGSMSALPLDYINALMGRK